MSDEWVKRVTDDAVWRLRNAATKLESGDAFVQSFTEHNRHSGQPRDVPPQVTVRAEGPNGIVEYVIVLPVKVRG